MTGQSSSQAATPVQWWKPALFFLVVIVGLWYVKWQPYYGKAFTAAETHSIGKSILAQADASPLQAAWDYAMVYFLAVWKAAVLGVILGSLIQVLIPRNWLMKTLGQPRFQGTLLGTIFSLPGMMCSCCAAPVAAGMRRQRVSMGGALAFWMGNPLLNPATLVFMGFVLGWHFAFIRLVAGLLTVLVRMNVFEMEGFLRGKCVPRDLKVNETNAEYLVRKFDALEAKCAALENKIIPVSAELPPANESVLLFDANGEGWLIGWRSLWYTWGQKETGEWQWTFQVGDIESVNITHWAVMPKAPEAGA